MRKFNLNNFINIFKNNIYIQLIGSIFFLSFIFTFYGALKTKFRFAGNAMINIESKLQTENKSNKKIYSNYRQNKLILENDNMLFPLYQKYSEKNIDNRFNKNYLSWKKNNFKIDLVTGTEIINIRYISKNKDEIKNLLTDLIISFKKNYSKKYFDQYEKKLEKINSKINILEKNLYQINKESFNESKPRKSNKDIELLINQELYKQLLSEINILKIERMLINPPDKAIKENNEKIDMGLYFNNLPLIEQKKFILFCISLLSLLMFIYINASKKIKSQ